jgi:hypothetical protein
MVEDLERRDEARLRRALACKLLVDGQARQGVLRDLSAQGAFVELHEDLPPGAGVILAFGTPEGPRFVLEATARRGSPVAHSLRDHASRGVGLRLHEPPPEYLHWVLDAAREAS